MLIKDWEYYDYKLSMGHMALFKYMYINQNLLNAHCFQ